MKKIISINDAPAALGAYSQAVEANGFVFTSGQIALKPNGDFVQGGVKEQTQQVMTNLSAVLAAADIGFKNVIKATIFLADINDFAIVNEVYASYFDSDFPARSAVGIKDLPKGALVEIEMIAIK